MEDKFRSILIWSNHTWHAFDIVSADVATAMQFNGDKVWLCTQLMMQFGKPNLIAWVIYENMSALRG